VSIDAAPEVSWTPPAVASLSGPELLDALADRPGPVAVPDATEEPVAGPVALMVVRLVVYRDDGTELIVDTDARDHRAYATLRHRYNLPASPGLTGPDGLLLLTFAAWNAARNRHGQTGDDWPTWDARTIAVDMEVEQAPVDPSPSGRGGG